MPSRSPARKTSSAGRSIGGRLALVILALAGCATFGDRDVQRATEGPTAGEIYMTRFVRGYGRIPTFDEEEAWRADLDRRISDYLVKHPDVGTSPRAAQFRFHRRIAVGMNKEEVKLLVGSAEVVTTDPAVMEASARQFWPHIKERGKEMWVYPGGWQLYFEDDRLVDLTATGRPPIE